MPSALNDPEDLRACKRETKPARHTVALWYRRYRDTEYMLLDDEETAARQAAYMLIEGEGWPVGVQFEDGRLIEAEDWVAFAAAVEACRAPWQTTPHSRRPTRKIRAPFAGSNWVMDVPDDSPRWLGLPVRDAHPGHVPL